MEADVRDAAAENVTEAEIVTEVATETEIVTATEIEIGTATETGTGIAMTVAAADVKDRSDQCRFMHRNRDAAAMHQKCSRMGMHSKINIIL